LAIVKAIAEAHHGQVTLRSQLGTGSTFTLVLPLELTSGLH
jgi:signal transduction histidine kinase